jgi:hypothetical protein
MMNSVLYSVRVKTGASWRRHSRVRLMVSVGQEYHEGAKLGAVVAWINRNPTIQEVHVSVNGFLQRHNLVAAGVPANDAGELALEAEASWIARNHRILAEIRTAGWHMTRWRDWLDRPEFSTRQAALKEFARAEREANEVRKDRRLPPVATLQDAIEHDARTFAGRRANPDTQPDRFARLVAHSRDYVQEELSVFAMQTEELPAAEIYPGSNLASAAYLAGRGDLPPPLRPLARREFTRIDFARINFSQQAAHAVAQGVRNPELAL